MNYVDDPSDPDCQHCMREHTISCKIILFSAQLRFSFFRKDSKVKSESNTNVKVERGTPNQSKLKYSQKFCEKWVSVFSPWLARCEDDRNKPFCRACQCRLDCNRCHLQRHERTSKHARNLQILVNKGEGAARQNLSIRQERSKYYQQRKKVNTSADSPDESEMGVGDDYIEEADTETITEHFQYEQTDQVSGENFTGVEIICKQESVPLANVEEYVLIRSLPRNNSGRPRKGVQKPTEVDSNTATPVRKDGIKLLMQIHKNKNELMEFMNNSMSQQSSPKEKNHVDLFFESVSSSVKALSPKLIAETKMRVSQLICEMEIRALNERDANTSTLVVTAEGSSGAYIINQQKTESQLAHQQSDEDNHYEALS
ncbi:protein suppressor of variegation 3-7-like isoform X1 [Glossina fuscipes]|uniref:Protein suppressor of variegation 3-7-like isoform X1 n=1 Tax=Glossina fuscipes TaxID=7396 RepID=A0A8U0WJP2_9MUSC|nr:protein suppressor of variegation 3-7-like isoform X1 [Glossina fuscipes]